MSRVGWGAGWGGAALLSVAVACGSTASPPRFGPICLEQGLGCGCVANTDGDSTGPGPPFACNPAAYPGSTCCASPSWPSSGSCACAPTEVACGIVDGYFGALFDGGPTAGCVCSPGSYAQRGQVTGATCGPGDWAKPASTVGVCCFYPADFPGQVDGATCACGPAFVCAPGSTHVDSCSAASFPPAATGCSAGYFQVASCSGDAEGGAPVDAESSDAASPDDAPMPPMEAGICGSGPPSACNTVTNLGTTTTASCIAGPTPTQTGGTLEDGTYVLVSGTAYAASCSGVTVPPGGPSTLVVTAGCMQSIDATGGAQTYTWSTSGNLITMNEVCPGSATVILPFTATSTTLSEVGPLTTGVDVVSVFQKQ